MTELLVLGVIIVAVLGFFNRDRIKNRFFPDKQRNYTMDDQFNSDKRNEKKKLTAC